MLKIDTHAHWYPPEWVDLILKEGEKNGAKLSDTVARLVKQGKAAA